MVKFLINRPTSVLMAFLACCILGAITLFQIPVSLLPDIPIPEITVQITGYQSSARALENIAVSPVRQMLSQVSGLRDIHSEARDGNAILHLSFEYGTNTDLAFVEVNEKIDAAMNYLPKEVERPRVIKASATDIPVQYLNLTLRSDKDFKETNEAKFMELSNFAQSIVKRRLEQLPEVSMVDVTGVMNRQVVIAPDQVKLELSGITLSDIESALNSNNVEPGSMIVKDGYYEYNIRFSAVVRTIEDLRHIFIRKNDRIYQLSDLAQVDFIPEKETGMALYRGKRCIKLAIIKQPDVNMTEMQKAVNKVVDDVRMTNPDVEIHASENQTELLDYSISNLEQNLILAFLFVWLVSVFFMKDMRAPIIIGISMVVSVIVSLLLFYLFHLSLNVVSLTGLILASGNMIDNSIVVSDNIGQYRQRGLMPKAACIKGTNEVIAPMLSSAFTSISVFAPLIFMSGIAGALFLDQALSVTIGLMVSFVTGIVLIPVLYNLLSSIHSKRFQKVKQLLHIGQKEFEVEKVSIIEKVYHRGIEWIFNHKRLTAVSMLAVLPLCGLLFWWIPKEKMPDLHQKELVTTIEWNENIHVRENLERSRELLHFLSPKTVEQTGLVGQQQFLLNREREKTSSETEIYLKVENADQLPELQEAIKKQVLKQHPQALISFAPSGTIFEKVFSTGTADLVVECHPLNQDFIPTASTIHSFENVLQTQTGEYPEGVSFQKQLNLQIDREKLLLHHIPYELVYQTLKTAFQENKFATLRSYQQYIPIVLGSEERTVQNILDHTLIATSENSEGRLDKLTLNRFVTISPSVDLKSLIAGKSGEYIPISFAKTKHPEAIMKVARTEASKGGIWEVDFSGGFFSNQKMIGELMLILFISILLMYFILVAQFESFVQPLIILMEIPIDLAAALALLLLFGHTLNLMSAIGMVVSCGIIINDSILKVDVMNQLRKEGFSLMDAIHEAGRRRLKAILMTSLTSIVCMVPLLFTNDLGSELEKPLAITTIGGMLMGTPVSLFVVPLIYWWIYKKQDSSKSTFKNVKP